MFVSKPNVYYPEEDYMVGILNNGEKYKVDIEDYERLDGKTCYPNKEQISIRVNK